MLRKSPEHRPNAAELLRHPHLQPYVLQVNLKSSPAHNSLPVPHPASNHIKKIRFLDSGNLFVCKEKDKRRSLGNERILNHNQPATARQDSVSSTRSIEGYPDYRNQRTRDLSVRSQVGESSVTKAINRMPNVRNTPACTPCKTFTTPKKQLEPSEGIHTGLNRKLRPTSTPVDRLARPNHRASLPFPAFETPDRWNPSVLHRIESPDVSVNAPRIDWIAEFPLASSEDPLHSAGKAASVHGSSSATPRCVGRSLTKDKCTVHIFGAEGDSGSGSSSRNPVAAGHDASSRGSSDSQQRRFDTSSHWQRAEALEGLLEFSAQLLQQERFDELGVLLKPFGTEKASPRETAIWLTKSFNETTV